MFRLTPLFHVHLPAAYVPACHTPRWRASWAHHRKGVSHAAYLRLVCVCAFEGTGWKTGATCPELRQQAAHTSYPVRRPRPTQKHPCLLSSFIPLFTAWAATHAGHWGLALLVQPAVSLLGGHNWPATCGADDLLTAALLRCHHHPALLQLGATKKTVDSLYHQLSRCSS